MTEVKDIAGYEGLYTIDTHGNVYSIKSGRYLTPCATYDGHMAVNLYKRGTMKRMSIHRLVATAFLPNPDNHPVVHHLDDNPRNNHVNNLKWCTQKENVHHTIIAGKHGKMWGRK